jgi:hypothetical protein
MQICMYGVLTLFIYKDGYGIYSDYHTTSRGFIQFLYTRGHQTFYLTGDYEKLNIANESHMDLPERTNANRNTNSSAPSAFSPSHFFVALFWHILLHKNIQITIGDFIKKTSLLFSPEPLSSCDT